jgi:hypothetical protein
LIFGILIEDGIFKSGFLKKVQGKIKVNEEGILRIARTVNHQRFSGCDTGHAG